MWTPGWTTQQLSTLPSCSVHWQQTRYHAGRVEASQWPQGMCGHWGCPAHNPSATAIFMDSGPTFSMNDPMPVCSHWPEDPPLPLCGPGQKTKELTPPGMVLCQWLTGGSGSVTPLSGPSDGRTSQPLTWSLRGPYEIWVPLVQFPLFLPESLLLSSTSLFEIISR